MAKCLLFNRLVWLLVCAVVWQTRLAGSAAILALTLHNARSHFVAFEPLLARLIQAGHNVTIVAHHQLRCKPPGAAYHYVPLGDDDRTSRLPIPAVKRTTPLSELRLLRTLNVRYARFLRNDQLRRLTDGEDGGHHFDLVLADTFISRLALPFVNRLAAPFILVSSTDLFPHTACNLAAACLNPAHELWPHSGLADRTAFASRYINCFTFCSLKSKVISPTDHFT